MNTYLKPAVDGVIAYVLITLLAACASKPPAPPAAAAAPQKAVAPGASTAARGQLQIPLANGRYRCEQNAQVDVRSDPKDPNRIEVGWKGSRYQLVRQTSTSGLPRYEENGGGKLVWVMLPWKSLLLDGRTNQPLANECKVA